MSMLPADAHRRLDAAKPFRRMDPQLLLDRFMTALPQLVLCAPPHDIPDAERLALLNKLQRWVAVTIMLHDVQQRRLEDEALLPDLLAASEAAEPSGDAS